MDSEKIGYLVEGRKESVGAGLFGTEIAAARHADAINNDRVEGWPAKFFVATFDNPSVGGKYAVRVRIRPHVDRAFLRVWAYGVRVAAACPPRRESPTDRQIEELRAALGGDPLASRVANVLMRDLEIYTIDELVTAYQQDTDRVVSEFRACRMVGDKLLQRFTEKAVEWLRAE